jgi:chemotaxis protein CheD
VVKRTVGLAEMALSNDPDDMLITHSLGSCLGVVLHDAAHAVGAMLHAMLPLSTINPEKAAAQPFMFVDTGVPRLLTEFYQVGGCRKNLVVKVAGGAAIGPASGREDFFAIGSRNMIVLRKILWKNGLLLSAADVGGSRPRTVSLAVGTGEVLIRSDSVIKTL